jgi:hypothetical protein
MDRLSRFIIYIAENKIDISINTEMSEFTKKFEETIQPK